MADTATLATTRPSEVRLSADGNRIFSAGTDGNVRVYDARTGALLDTWDIGQKLGGMDISPDGSFLMIVERNLSTTYRVDTTTGAKTTYNYATSGYDGLLFDVAVLSDGTALFSQDFNGSGWTALKVLNLETGIYTTDDEARQSSVLTRSPTGEFVFVGEPNTSGGTIDIYQTGAGIVETTGAAGFNWGQQAFSGTLAAQYIYNEGIHVYNAELERQVTLTAWNNGAVSDLAFSADSAFLYILENHNNTIVKVSTADWDIDDTIPVNATLGGWIGQIGVTTGSRLIIDPKERYFSVVTEAGLVLVENPDAPAIVGTGNSDLLEGALFGDEMFGMAGDDALIGFGGDDTMNGGTGDDVFFVDSAGDAVIELAGEGNDRVVASASFTLGVDAEVEKLETSSYTGTTAIDLTGSSIANTILGNNGANVFDGGAGDDTIHGFAGNDYLYGSTGVDNMYGGAGDDHFYMAFNDGDRVWEFAGEGYDVVSTEVDYTLPDVSGVERLEAGTLTATSALYLGGSNLDNLIIGNAGNNTLRGFAGADTLHGLGGDDVLIGDEGGDVMYGGAGDDVYYVNSDYDQIVEAAGEGNDRVSSVGSYTLNGSAYVETLEASNSSADYALNLTGSDSANLIVGNNGANWLDGKGGNDVLVGLGGADTFAFTAAPGSGNVDTIEGFVAGTDHIALDDAILADLSPGSMDANRFVVGSAAGDADDRVIYDSATGALWFDADGNGAGAAVQIALVNGHPALTAGDLLII